MRIAVEESGEAHEYRQKPGVPSSNPAYGLWIRRRSPVYPGTTRDRYSTAPFDHRAPNPGGSPADSGMQNVHDSSCRHCRYSLRRLWSDLKTCSSLVPNLFVMLLVLSSIIAETESVEWLAVAKNHNIHWNQTKDCRLQDGRVLTRHQQKICAGNLDLMYAVVHASLQTAQVCQELFMDNRWNCSNILRAPNFWPDLTEGTREQAIVYALASASLTQAVAKTCSSGYSKKCSCHRETGRDVVGSPGDFKWGGCGDDVQFASRFAQTFTDQTWLKNREKSRKSVVNLHNNRLGRKMMEESLGKVCKCHGVSGSCSVKTCWHALPELKTVGLGLMNKYSEAVKVTLRKVPLGDRRSTRSSMKHAIQDAYANVDNSVVDYGGEAPMEEEESQVHATDERLRQQKQRQQELAEEDEEGRRGRHKEGGFKRVLVNSENRQRGFTDADLLFVTLSPDYCSEDLYVGSPGTVGRECYKNETHTGGCKSMCCGRGFTTEKVTVQYRCDCKYYWCCYVKCKVCTKVVEQNRCK